MAKLTTLQAKTFFSGELWFKPKGSRGGGVERNKFYHHF